MRILFLFLLSCNFCYRSNPIFQQPVELDQQHGRDLHDQIERWRRLRQWMQRYSYRSDPYSVYKLIRGINLCILIEKMNEIGWKWSKLINDLEVCSNWFLELLISLENFIKTIAHFAIVSLFFAIVQSAKRVIDRTVPLVEKSLWLFVNFGRFVSS